MMALGVIRVSSPLGLLGIDVAICHLYQLTDGRRPLMVEHSTELLM
jgi:hypothetical protein